MVYLFLIKLPYSSKRRWAKKNGALGLLQVHENGPRVFHSSFDLFQERHRLSAIDKPVVISQGDLHDRPDFHLQVLYLNNFLKSKCDSKFSMLFMSMNVFNCSSNL